MKICANCTTELKPGMATGESSLYSTERFILCETCFHEEDKFIEETGRNNHPDRIRKYRHNVSSRTTSKVEDWDEVADRKGDGPD